MRLSEVESAVFVGLRKRMLGAMNREKRGGLMHVTDYATTCRRKSYYQKTKAGQGHDGGNFGSVSSLFLGLAVHQMIESGSDPEMSEVKLAYNIPKGTSVDPESIESMSTAEKMDTVIGTMDALYPMGGQYCIVDYKTWSSNKYRKQSVNPEHKKQVNMYRLMLKAKAGIDAKYGAVAYLDTSQKLEKVQVFPFEMDKDDVVRADFISAHAQFKRAMETGELPDRTAESWLCDGYCPYQKRCFSEERLEGEDNRLD